MGDNERSCNIELRLQLKSFPPPGGPKSETMVVVRKWLRQKLKVCQGLALSGTGVITSGRTDTWIDVGKTISLH